MKKALKIKDFIDYLNQLYPTSNAEIWDPTGYALRTVQSKKFKGAVLAIDVTEEVVQSAIDNDCNVILTHHPFRFEADWKSENAKAPYKRPLYDFLRQKQITVYSMHTNYDCDSQGTSYQIANFMNLAEKVDLNSPKFSVVLNADLTVSELSDNLKQNLLLQHFRTNVEDLNQKFHKVAILSGSGYIGQIVEMSKDIDLFISSDFRWSDWITFKESKINILEIPHLDEQVFAWHMHSVLQENLPEYKFVVQNISVPYKNI
ncbi:Nif3-like dinuclear metal center hexameric protein [Mycoplasma nasistruthionis]|uniref:GTP cyclohydrolase 1 type 2 homolog n=1 Tax=Mycoplasma nasistruthionis TaxID=353852 RepID=A0A4Y6I5J6_9MOLU|nr:Nif3-like dinuclear metal center hexameric protein [Mycoplasma nasistruthionis]QCZ36586.1 Nif3-like dinuclear metal center hexameric protein [Mycoplasma nasistruthionis]QDF64886.1 Nif3-like dinuclear metal center hexameric protein [Mycoplasma nasistruthionis]